MTLHNVTYTHAFRSPLHLLSNLEWRLNLARQFGPRSPPLVIMHSSSIARKSNNASLLCVRRLVSGHSARQPHHRFSFQHTLEPTVFRLDYSSHHYFRFCYLLSHWRLTDLESPCPFVLAKDGFGSFQHFTGHPVYFGSWSVVY